MADISKIVLPNGDQHTIKDATARSGLNNKVDKVTGKGLSTNDYTTTEKDKLAGIAAGAEANVQSDWNVTDSASDAFIKNKPTIPTLPEYIVTDANYVHTDNNYTTAEKNKLAGVATGAEANVQSDWDETDSTSDAYILNKPTIPDVSGYVAKSGDTMTGNLTMGSTSHGFYLKDSSGYNYPGIYDNGANLWLGATATDAQHHRGSTFISAGYNGSAGNETIYVSVPNAANNNASNYAVWHEHNFPKSHASTATTYGIGNASKYGHVKLSDTYSTLVNNVAAANGVAASSSALYQAWRSHENAIVNHHKISESNITWVSGYTHTDYGSKVINYGINIHILVLNFTSSVNSGAGKHIATLPSTAKPLYEINVNVKGNAGSENPFVQINTSGQIKLSSYIGSVSGGIRCEIVYI